MKYFLYGEKELAYLKRKDKRLKAAIEQIGMIQRPVHDDIFEALISSIVGQQISSKAAMSVWNRLVGVLEEVTPAAIVNTSLEAIQACGMSMRKAEYIKHIADLIHCKELDLDRLHVMSDEEVINVLSSLKGIGKWTAQMLMIFSMQRPDVIAWDDLAIRRGMMRLYHHKTLTKEQFERYRRRYSPYSTVASLYLWELSK